MHCEELCTKCYHPLKKRSQKCNTQHYKTGCVVLSDSERMNYKTLQFVNITLIFQHMGLIFFFGGGGFLLLFSSSYSAKHITFIFELLTLIFLGHHSKKNATRKIRRLLLQVQRAQQCVKLYPFLNSVTFLAFLHVSHPRRDREELEKVPRRIAVTKGMK